MYGAEHLARLLSRLSDVMPLAQLTDDQLAHVAAMVQVCGRGPKQVVAIATDTRYAAWCFRQVCLAEISQTPQRVQISDTFGQGVIWDVQK